MWQKLINLFRGTPAPPPKSEEQLLLEQEAQSLRIQVEEQARLINTLKQELERQRSNASTEVSEATQMKSEELFNDMAAPITQLMTQTHLFEVEDKPVKTRDVLLVAKRLVRALEDHGLTLTGQVGETVSFDPNYHEALGSASLNAGDSAIIRFVGVTYQGKVLRKASVAKAEG